MKTKSNFNQRMTKCQEIREELDKLQDRFSFKNAVRDFQQKAQAQVEASYDEQLGYTLEET